MAATCFVEKSDLTNEKGGNTKNPIQLFQTDIRSLLAAKELKILLILFALTTLFLQPFFQYWQVLYQECGVSVRYFGIIYVIFQVCNLCGTYIYKKMKEKYSLFGWILLLIPIIILIEIMSQRAVIFLFPAAVFLFYVYQQHLDVIRKRISPAENISACFSLIGTIENVASVISLFFMAISIERFGIGAAYVLLFTVFAVVSMLLLYPYRNKFFMKV